MAAKPGRGSSSMEQLGPVGKFGLVFLLMLVVGAGYFILVYEELAQAITAAQDREATLRGELQRAQASKEAYQRDLEEKTRLEQVGREQKKVLPDDPETPAFLSALQGAAIVAGVNLTSWSPTEEVPREFFAKVPMKLTLTGRFHQVVKFFHSVGQLDRIINIENIQVKAVTDKAADTEVSVECLATAFRAVRLDDAAGAARRRGAGR